MILVDTSVWIDYLRGHDSAAVRLLEDIFEQQRPYGITGLIYQEILQGADSLQSFNKLKRYFETQRFYHARDADESYAGAAEIYFLCRRAGITVRSSMDCLIARIAIENDLYLLHDDRDYSAIAGVVPELKLLPA